MHGRHIHLKRQFWFEIKLLEIISRDEEEEEELFYL